MTVTGIKFSKVSHILMYFMSTNIDNLVFYIIFLRIFKAETEIVPALEERAGIHAMT